MSALGKVVEAAPLFITAHRAAAPGKNVNFYERDDPKFLFKPDVQMYTKNTPLEPKHSDHLAT